jgi:hypothetical protein
MSPTEAQLAPEPAQRPPWQLPEQQAASEPHRLPSVPQPPPTSAWHWPATQLLLQHSPLEAHACVVLLQTEAEHAPPTQAPLQQAVETVQAPPAPVQLPTFTEQVFDAKSHTPEQHAALVVHACPGPPQLTFGGGTPASLDPAAPSLAAPSAPPVAASAEAPPPAPVAAPPPAPAATPPPAPVPIPPPLPEPAPSRPAAPSTAGPPAAPSRGACPVDTFPHP